MLHQAGFLAQKRLARGLRLNYPEAVALIATQLLEFIRDGRSVAELMDLGRQLLGRADVHGRRAGDDRRGAGRRHVPGRHQARDRAPPDRGRARRPDARALRQLPAGAATRPADGRRRGDAAAMRARRGASRSAGEIVLNEGRDDGRSSPVTNRGDRPIQVGSHYHFVETNRALDVRSRRGLRHAPRHPRRHRRALRARRDEDRHARADRRRARHPRRQRLGERSATSVASADLAEHGLGPEEQHEPPHRPRALRRHLRPDHRRSRAARRHGPRRRSRARPRRLRRRVQVRRRQGAARRHGPGGRRQRRRRARLRHHQRAHRRLDRHLQGRRRHQGRPHRRHRQGRQSRRDGRRHAGHGRRRHDRGDRRRGPDPHRRRHRLAHPLHLPAAGLRGARERRDDVHRRRHRAGDRHQRDDVHAGRAAHRADAAGDRRAADELRLPRQGQHVAARGPRRADSRRRDRPEAARGLGHDAGGDRLLPGGRRAATTCR